MKKSILLFLFSVFYLTGCATFSKWTAHNQELRRQNPFLYRPFTEYVETHGAPIFSYKIEGDKYTSAHSVYTFIEPCPSSPTMQKIIVTVVDEGHLNGEITKIQTENTCPEN